MNKIIGKVLGSKYDNLWRYVIRPERDDYSLDELGPKIFEHYNKIFKRTDLTLTNKRNLKLCCSFWEPEERKYPKLPCVIYLHGNSSSRTEIFPELYYLLSSDITVFAFDFSGCGKSEGEYISLGWYERDDVECVVNYLRSTNKVATIGLWGRSMGAVTAIMYGDRDPSIAGMVLDSPFCSLKVLTEETISKTVKTKKSSSKIKSLVSKNKNRFCYDGYDLDLTYITTRIIAMGIPSTSIKGIYRNSMDKVQSFLNTRHPSQYKVFNLCKEKEYSDDLFFKQGYYPIEDHEAPPINSIIPFCLDAKAFLDEDENNIIAVHSKAGKGRAL